MSHKYYVLDDGPPNLLLRKNGPWVSKLTTEGWEMWTNRERFDQRSEEISRDEALAIAQTVCPDEADKV